MENEKRWKTIARKYWLPVSVFIICFLFVFLLLNFLTNAVMTAYHAYFVKGTFFTPAPIEFSAGWIFNPTHMFGNIILLGIVLILSSIAGGFMLYKIKSSFGSLNTNQKGSSRFTTLKEIQQQYKAVPEIAERYDGGGGVPVSRYKDKIFIDDSAVNNLIVGTTRSGKGETFIFPTIDIYSRAEKQPSMIFNDPKGELYASSKETLERLGYHVEVLNLMNPMQSMSYNLLELVKQAYFADNFSLAQQYARSISFMLYDEPTAKDKFWANSSTDLCTALILGLCEHCRTQPEKITMYNVALMMGELGTEMVTDENGKNISKLDAFFNQFPTNHPARLQYQTINFAGGQTRASILANTNAKLAIFTLDGTAKLTSKNTLDMTKFGFGRWVRGKAKPLARVNVIFPNGKVESIKTDVNGAFTLYHNHDMKVGDTISVLVEKELESFSIVDWDKESGDFTVDGDSYSIHLTSVMQFEKPIALFMIVPDYDSTFNVIASLYVKQLYTTLARTASNVRAGKCFREVVFILDEFGNMPSIDGMANILTVCLGRNIRFNLVIQAYSQLEKNYGDDWKTIDGNTNNTFYILTDDHATAETISKKIGEKTIVVKSRSGETLSLDKSKTENLESRPLLNADELMRLREGEMIVIRTIKRQDLNRKRIQQFPIFNTKKTKMKYRWEYLNDYYDTNKSINDIEIPCEHAHMVLDEMRAIFDIQTVESEPPKTSPQEVGIIDISNGAGAMTRKPPKPKPERMEETKPKPKHELNEHIFKQAIVKGSFEEIFGENFQHLSYDEIKHRLNLYQEHFDSKLLVKLQAMIDNVTRK